MKIAVINFSGNVGKSTIARHLVAPRLNNARVIAIESINSDEGIQDGTIRGNQFGELLDVLVQLDDVVVDIGASNVEDFVKLMSQYRGSHEDFDYYIVPTVSKTKQQRDTISTIDALADLGIPAKKIRLVFNMVEQEENVEHVFSSLFQYQAVSTLRPHLTATSPPPDQTPTACAPCSPTTSKLHCASSSCATASASAPMRTASGRECRATSRCPVRLSTTLH